MVTFHDLITLVYVGLSETIKTYTMKCRHIFEKRVYLISNRATAANPIFMNSRDQSEFIEKMDQYLSPICNILAHSLHDDQFQLLIETKSRRSFSKFFKDTHKGKTSEEFFIPLSTHIFSRQMSNLQVSVAKKFNFRNNRSGALFCARFERLLIESESEVQIWAERLNNKIRYFKSAKKWMNQFLQKDNEVLNCMSGKKLYDWRVNGKRLLETGVSANLKGNLGDCFLNKLEPDHLPLFLRKYMLEFRIKHPCGPNYN